MIWRVSNYFGGKPVLHFKDFVDKMTNPIGPSIMVKNRHHRIDTLLTNGTPQASSKDLGNQ
jgi:hypothetical protein